MMPRLARCFFVVAAELLLEHAVDELQLLLLAELNEVLGLANTTAPVFTRRVGPAIEVLRLVVVEELTSPAAHFGPRSGVASHF